MEQAVRNLNVTPDLLLIDAMELEVFDTPQAAIIKGDQKSVSIAAASVVAKVTRDRMMKELDAAYPNYDFKKNMGYGTKNHLNGLKSHGVTPYHRVSFNPVPQFMKL